MKELEGKRAIVTGGGTGLGAAVSRGLARLGASVLVNYARSADAAEAVAAECRELGVDAFAMQGDVSADADCTAMARAAADRLGGVDILINNAGVTKFARHRDLGALQLEDFERLYRVNTVGPYLMTRAVEPLMREAGAGAIVNVSSIAGVTGIGSSIAYCASKGALNTMTLCLARALAPVIRVNAVCPGYIGSDWFAKYQGEDAAQATARNVAETMPLRVASTPEDIAGTVLFLAGIHSRHMTGETLMIDAGMHLGSAPLKAR